MKNWTKYIFLLLLISFICRNASAISNKKGEKQRHFKNEKLDDYKSQKSFSYVEMEVNQSDIYKRWKNKTRSILEAIFGSEVTNFISRNILYILLIFVVFILLLNSKRLLNNLYKGNDIDINNYMMNIDEENIDELNFDKSINAALAESNYRLAMRYQFLKLLKELSTNNIIKWQPYKTNYEYLLEIKDSTINLHFKKVSLIFDHIWYGNFNFNKKSYIETEKEFNEFYFIINKK